MKPLTIILAALALTGCANQRFDLRASDAVPTQTQTHSFWVSGIGQSKGEDAAKVCGGAAKVARVEMQQTATDVLIGAVTLGIYTPREMRITCVR
jgi:outer membrane PBP1 activator LpoA protein